MPSSGMGPINAVVASFIVCSKQECLLFVEGLLFLFSLRLESLIQPEEGRRGTAAGSWTCRLVCGRLASAAVLKPNNALMGSLWRLTFQAGHYPSFGVN